MKIKINNKEYSVDVAKTAEEMKKGLEGINYLPENEGMLFIFDDEQEVSFHMTNTLIPLDIIFIDADLDIISIANGKPLDPTPHIEQDVKYVLELNANSGVTTDSELQLDDSEFDEDDDITLLVLDSTGNVQMELESGERIFSRIHTKSLIEAALKARETQSDKDYISLGKKVIKYITIQDNNNPEYVELKN